MHGCKGLEKQISKRFFLHFLCYVYILFVSVLSPEKVLLCARIIFLVLLGQINNVLFNKATLHDLITITSTSSCKIVGLFQFKAKSICSLDLNLNILQTQTQPK